MKKDVSTKELMELMKAGKLLAKDILPLLGKEFADMARQGGALRYALNSLNSVQGRLNKSFKDWVYSIYQGGLLDGLRDLYKTLDQLFYYMSQGADSAIGKFLKGFLGQLENSIVFIYNNMLDLYYMLKYDFGFAGADMELLGKVAYWATIVGSLNAVLKLMQIIFGGAMIGAIGRAAAALTGFGVAAAGAAGGTAASGAAGGLASGAATGAAGGLLAKAGMAARITGGVGLAYLAADAIASSLNSYLYQFPSYVKADKAVTKAMYDPSMFSSPDKMRSIASSYYPSTAQVNRDDKPIKLEVKVNDSLFAKAIEFSFQENMNKTLNTLIPAKTSTPSLIVR